MCALEPEIHTSSYSGYSDTVSSNFGLTDTCGHFAYSFLEPFPSFASVQYTEGDSFFQISIDLSSYAQDGTYTLFLVVQLVNYPTSVAKVYQEFKVQVLPTLDPFIPPSPPEVKKE